jgi:hypothetical protein
MSEHMKQENAPAHHTWLTTVQGQLLYEQRAHIVSTLCGVQPLEKHHNNVRQRLFF